MRVRFSGCLAAVAGERELEVRIQVDYLILGDLLPVLVTAVPGFRRIWPEKWYRHQMQDRLRVLVNGEPATALTMLRDEDEVILFMPDREGNAVTPEVVGADEETAKADGGEAPGGLPSPWLNDREA